MYYFKKSSTSVCATNYVINHSQPIALIATGSGLDVTRHTFTPTKNVPSAASILTNIMNIASYTDTTDQLINALVHTTLRVVN